MGNKTIAFLLIAVVFFGGMGVGIYLGNKVFNPTVGHCINSLLGQ